MNPNTPDRRAAYRLALRAVAFAALFWVVVYAVDAALLGLLREGVRVHPKLPPPEFARLFAAEDQVLHLGDSTLVYAPRHPEDPAAPPDTAPPMLFQQVAAHLGRAVHAVARPARGAHHLASELEFLREQDVRPEAVLVAVNLRAFAPDRQQRPGVHDGVLDVMLRTGSTLPLRGLSVLRWTPGELSVAAYRERTYQIPGSPPRPLLPVDQPQGDPAGWSDDLVRRRFLVRYAARWPAPEILARLRDELAALHRETGVPVVVYLTPLPLERYAHLLTDADRAAVQTHLDRLHVLLDLPGVVGLDLTGELAPGEFVDPWHTPGEHMNLPARERVAARLAEALRGALASD